MAYDTLETRSSYANGIELPSREALLRIRLWEDAKALAG